MKHYVVCGFSGVGKSTAEQRHNNVVDFESSGFSHFWAGEKYGEKNPDFPQNYIDALCEELKKEKRCIYLISCHEEVRKELKERGVDYVIVMPKFADKNEYLKRWLRRGSPIEFVKLMDARWVAMHTSCENDTAPKIYLEDYEYIDDVLPT